MAMHKIPTAKALKLKNEIKSYVVLSGTSFTKAAKLIQEKYNRSESQQSLSAKLARGTIKYIEAQELADVIGYKIVWMPKD